MLTRSQIHALSHLVLLGPSHRFFLPEFGLIKLTGMLSDANAKFNLEINTALREAALGEQVNLDNVVKMVEANPRLLLQAGNVTTRGGTKIIRTTLYEFFLGSAYAEAAERIAPYFANIIDQDGKSIGEVERVRQYERYRVHIEQLKWQVLSYQQAYEAAGCSAEKSIYTPAYDLRPFINLITKETSPFILTEIENPTSPLNQAMNTFRAAINDSQQSRSVGMHYAHYTTIMQVIDLLAEKWDCLNIRQKEIIFCQILGYLQLVGLPARQRIAFAHTFPGDKALSMRYAYEVGVFPDFNFTSPALTSLGFKFGVAGRPVLPQIMSQMISAYITVFASDFKLHLNQMLETLSAHANTKTDQDSPVAMPSPRN